jgi:hypothetical protein
MQWLVLLKLILDLISKLPLDQQAVLSDEELEVLIRNELIGSDDVAIAGLADIDWEAAIPHIVALVKIFRAGFTQPGVSV